MYLCADRVPLVQTCGTRCHMTRVCPGRACCAHRIDLNRKKVFFCVCVCTCAFSVNVKRRRNWAAAHGTKTLYSCRVNNGYATGKTMLFVGACACACVGVNIQGRPHRSFEHCRYNVQACVYMYVPVRQSERRFTATSRGIIYCSWCLRRAKQTLHTPQRRQRGRFFLLFFV